MKLKSLILVTSISILVGCSCGDTKHSNDSSASTERPIVQDGSHKREGMSLPFYGPITKNELDTSFYQIPKFYLTDQTGEGFGYSTFNESIMVVDFFFTTCSTICPIMTDEMVKLQEKLKEDDLMGVVKFLSVTIDPETDTPEQLKSYADSKGADLENWKFATGELEYIDELSKEGFFLAVDRNVAYQDGIIHSSQLILVDKNRHVRGSYDGIDEEEMTRLYIDINSLRNE